MNLATALFFPRRAVDRARLEQPVFWAVFLPVVFAVGSSGASMLLSQQVTGKTIPVLFFLGYAFLEFLLVLLMLGAATLLIRFFATLARAQGSLESLVWGLVLSLSPGVLALPFALCVLPLGKAGVALAFLAKLGLFLWIFALQVGAVGRVYSMSVPRALFTVTMALGSGVLAYLVFSWFAFSQGILTLLLWSTPA